MLDQSPKTFTSGVVPDPGPTGAPCGQAERGGT